MSNEYSHLKEVFEIEDVYSFSLGHFEDMYERCKCSKNGKTL